MSLECTYISAHDQLRQIAASEHPPIMNYLGFGLGLRTQGFQHVVDEQPAVDWFEILSENFMVHGGKPRYNPLRC